MKDGKGERKGNCKGKGIVKQTPGGDNMSGAVALQLQKCMRQTRTWRVHYSRLFHDRKHWPPG